MDLFETIKEYRKLADSGVITEEEFNNKKRKLLGMPEGQKANCETHSKTDVDNADEFSEFNTVKNYKELLDAEIITTEEYEKKKKKILGISNEDEQELMADMQRISDKDRQRKLEEERKAVEEHQRMVEADRIAEREHQRKVEEDKLAEQERQRELEEEKKLKAEHKLQRKEERKGKLRKNKGKILLVIGLIIGAIIFIVLVATHTICLKHSYSEATVVQPKTCWYCGKTEGKPKDLEKIKFPTVGIGSILPIPKSDMGEILWENSDDFNVYIGETTKKDYENYVDKCMKMGFDVDYQRDEYYFYAYDSKGNGLCVSYEGSNIMEIDITKGEENADNESEGGVVENIYTAIDIPDELMNDEFKAVIDLFSKGFSESGLDVANATTSDDGENYIFYLEGLEFLGEECEEGSNFTPRVIYSQDAINNDGIPDKISFAFANLSDSNGYEETVEIVENIAVALNISDEGLIENDYSSSSVWATGEYATFTFPNLSLELIVRNTDGYVKIEIVPID